MAIKTKPSKQIPAIISNMLSVEVAPKDIEKALLKVNELRDRSKRPYSLDVFHTLIQLFNGDPLKTHAVFERLTCLAKLLEKHKRRFRPWVRDADRDPSLLHPGLIRSAALSELHATTRKTWFELDEFLDIALREAVPETDRLN